MRVVRSDLSHGHELGGVVVVVDVLRAFSTAAYAFAAGARAMVVAHSIAEIEALQRRHVPNITVGAQAGGRPIVGLDFGNSPASVAPLDLSGMAVIEYTAGGVRGLIDCDRASAVLAGSLVCARATAEYVRQLRPECVTFVITGLWTDRDGDEDHACADLIEAHLCGEQPWLEDFERRVPPVRLRAAFRRSRLSAPAAGRSGPVCSCRSIRLCNADATQRRRSADRTCNGR